MHTIYPYSLFILYSWFIPLNSYPYLAPPTFPFPTDNTLDLYICESVSVLLHSFVFQITHMITYSVGLSLIYFTKHNTL